MSARSSFDLWIERSRWKDELLFVVIGSHSLYLHLDRPIQRSDGEREQTRYLSFSIDSKFKLKVDNPNSAQPKPAIPMLTTPRFKFINVIKIGFSLIRSLIIGEGVEKAIKGKFDWEGNMGIVWILGVPKREGGKGCWQVWQRAESPESQGSVKGSQSIPFDHIGP